MKFFCKKNIGVILFVVGLVFLAINININTGINYEGYEVSKGMSLKDFVYVQSFEAISSSSFVIDILLDPLGYLMVMIGFIMLNKKSRYSKNAIVFCGVGIIASVCKMLMPFFLSPSQVLKVTIILMLVEIFSRAVIMYSFSILCEKQVDSYKHMEVGKDLRFATELYAIGMVISIILLFFERAQLPLARGASLFTSVCTLYAVIYYLYKVIRYYHKLSLFSDTAKEI